MLILIQFFLANAGMADHRMFSPKFNRDIYISKSEPKISATEAKKIAEERYGGKALGAKFEDSPTGGAYRVKLIKAGRVKMVTIEAK